MNKTLALIVEDDTNIGDVFSRTLKTVGFETEVIHSGATALTWLASNVPDVVILDIRLPHVSGVEILRQIRADTRLAKTPVIVTTAYPDSAVALQELADLVLIKPVNPSQLRALAKRLCSLDE